MKYHAVLPKSFVDAVPERAILDAIDALRDAIRDSDKAVGLVPHRGPALRIEIETERGGRDDVTVTYSDGEIEVDFRVYDSDGRLDLVPISSPSPI